MVDGRLAAAIGVAVDGRFAVTDAAGRRRGGLAGVDDIDLLQARSASSPAAPTTVLDGAAHQVVAGAIDQIAGRVGHERAVAREVQVAARVGDGEEPRPCTARLVDVVAETMLP